MKKSTVLRDKLTHLIVKEWYIWYVLNIHHIAHLDVLLLRPQTNTTSSPAFTAVQLVSGHRPSRWGPSGWTIITQKHTDMVREKEQEIVCFCFYFKEQEMFLLVCFAFCFCLFVCMCLGCVINIRCLIFNTYSRIEYTRTKNDLIKKSTFLL